jgi:hypothetical protein
VIFRCIPDFGVSLRGLFDGSPPAGRSLEARTVVIATPEGPQATPFLGVTPVLATLSASITATGERSPAPEADERTRAA